ncbi:Arylsulfatase [Diplonema papillatum]|nr:Arylsulfatase [Diplonema papillatum]
MLVLLAIAAIGAEKPNILFLWADDLGWGDLGCYGHPTSDTPHLDKLCSEGKKFMSMYTASPVCSPSRAGLLTGRYQTRTGVYPGVFWPTSSKGLPLNETTLAEVLRDQGGYDTAMVGKWHLGVGMNWEYIPTEQGFDRWLGAPYSHDMPDPTYCFASTEMGSVPGLECYVDPKSGTQPEPMHTTCPTGAREPGTGGLGAAPYVQVPLFNGTKETMAILAQPLNLTTLDEQYSTAAVDFVNGVGRTQGKPWFLYYAFQHTHHPDYASSVFFNTTDRGMFGDSLKALDWAVGEVLSAVQETGQEENTFVFFSSDNGPSLMREQRGGDAGPLRCGKGTTWEGGQRVPGIIKWPGKVAPGVAREVASALDLFATVLDITGLPMPGDRAYDSFSMLPFLVPNGTGVEAGPVRDFFYYWDANVDSAKNLNAIRWREWKAHYQTGGSHCNKGYLVPTCVDGYSSGPLAVPLLFNLNHDPGEHVPLNASDPTFKYVMEAISQLKTDLLSSPGLFGASAVTPVDPLSQPCVHPQCKDSNQSSLPQCCRTNPY